MHVQVSSLPSFTGGQPQTNRFFPNIIEKIMEQYGLRLNRIREADAMWNCPNLRTGCLITAPLSSYIEQVPQERKLNSE